MEGFGDVGENEGVEEIGFELGEVHGGAEGSGVGLWDGQVDGMVKEGKVVGSVDGKVLVGRGEGGMMGVEDG